MSAPHGGAATIFRDFEVGTSGTLHKPVKSDVRDWGAWLEALEATLTGANVNTIAATAYTVLATDIGKILNFTAATAVVVTVPAGLGSNFFCSFAQGGTGQVTLSGAAGVTLANADSQFATQAQYVRLTLWASAADVLVLEGRTA